MAERSTAPGGARRWRGSPDTAGPNARPEDFIRSNYRQVMAYVLRRAQSTQDAVDLVVATFVTALQTLGNAPRGHGTRAWLFLIARLLIDERYGVPFAAPRSPAIAAQAGETRLVVEIRGAVSDAFHRLSAADREILTLVAVEGLTVGDAGRVMGCLTRQAAHQLRRARERFARELDLAGVQV